MTKNPRRDIQMSPIESTAVQSHGYDEATGTMAVQLHNGKVYHYSGVPIEKYAAFTGSESPGRFWNTRIKTMHPHVEIDPREK